MEQTIIQLIGNVGFPIGVAVYLLVRVETKLESLTNAIINLAQTVQNKE